MTELSAPLFFSVVIPYYNRYEMAVNTIQSVLDQKYRDFELIVVNDGSTDGSGDQLEKRFSSNSNFRIIHQVNSERGASRNKGLKEAKGNYVIFFDSDDLMLDNHLQVLSEKINALNFPDFIATKYDFIRGNRRVASSTGTLNEGYYDYRLFLDGNPLACNVCVRKANPNLHLFEEDRALAVKEDWMFHLQNLRYQRLYLVDRVTLLLLDHSSRSISSDNKLLIEKTFLSEKWILKNVTLDDADQRKLTAQVHYFCAIHSYIDFHRMKALTYLKTAFLKGGLRWKYIVLLGKIIIGRRTILKLKFWQGEKTS